MTEQITLYTGPTPNGRKVAIALEEMALEYETKHVDILAGDQHTPEFLTLCPNNKFPVIIDPDGPEGAPLTLWESGAILWYLAEKTGTFLPTQGANRHLVHQWLMFQMAGVGPMFGQFAHFFFYAKDKHPYAIERYTNEMLRLVGVMDRHLAEREWFAGDGYSIADMAVFPWVEDLVKQTAFEDRLHLKRWADAIAARPAVVRGMNVERSKVRAEVIEGGMVGFNDEQRSELFGEKQHSRNTTNPV